jgi:septum formation protein
MDNLLPVADLLPVLPYALVLASTSPRRHELLASVGLTFTIEPPRIDEASIPTHGLTPAQMVAALALGKGQSVAQIMPDSIVIGADTVVVLDDVVLGKPTDEADAVAMLSRLQGRGHTVMTGVCVCYPGQPPQTVVEQTRVWMRPLTLDECQAYVATGEPMDKAGAYAIQQVGSTLIERIEGCYFNVVGLPLHRLMQQLTVAAHNATGQTINPTYA